MKYLVAKNPESQKKAHIWDDGDTYCRMYSTGGIGKKKYEVADSTDREICQMCKNVFSKYSPAFTTNDNPDQRIIY